MSPLIQPLVSTLRSRGFSEEIISEHWTKEGLARRKWFSVFGEGSILEVVEANRYVRVNVRSRPSPAGPFDFLAYVSQEYPVRPKTEFFNGRHDTSFEVLDDAGVRERLLSSS